MVRQNIAVGTYGGGIFHPMIPERKDREEKRKDTPLMA
jgi:hypothetical protein